VSLAMGHWPRDGLVLVALLAVGTLASCTGYSGTQAHQVRQWAAQYSVISNDRLVVADIDAMRRSFKADRLKDLTSNCAGLVDDAGTAYGNLPTPDSTLTNELNTAYEDFANAGSSCAAARSISSRKITGAFKKIGAGLVALDRATRRLASQGVH